MSERRIRLRVPPHAKRGEVVEIKTLIAHPMESGLRRDPSGELVPAHIIDRFECLFEGQPVFSADLNTGISANPYIIFHARVDRSGVFEFRWYDDDGSVYHDTASITVA